MFLSQLETESTIYLHVLMYVKRRLRTHGSSFFLKMFTRAYHNHFIQIYKTVTISFYLYTAKFYTGTCPILKQRQSL